jgi:predicted amino acid dehydrogenase
MGIGAGAFLIAAGAILAFAVHAQVSGIDVQTVGVILMIVGALGVALDLAVFAPRRRTVTTGTPATRTVVEERDVRN